MFNFFDLNDLEGWYSYKYTSNSNTYDWEKLKKEGKVEETIEEKDGFKTITKTFVSEDGSKTITSVSSSPIINETKKSIIELDKKINEAVKNEEYEKAAELKKEKDKLLKK